MYVAVLTLLELLQRVRRFTAKHRRCHAEIHHGVHEHCVIKRAHLRPHTVTVGSAKGLQSSAHKERDNKIVRLRKNLALLWWHNGMQHANIMIKHQMHDAITERLHSRGVGYSLSPVVALKPHLQGKSTRVHSQIVRRPCRNFGCRDTRASKHEISPGGGAKSGAHSEATTFRKKNQVFGHKQKKTRRSFFCYFLFPRDFLTGACSVGPANLRGFFSSYSSSSSSNSDTFLRRDMILSSFMLRTSN